MPKIRLQSTRNTRSCILVRHPLCLKGMCAKMVIRCELKVDGGSTHTFTVLSNATLPNIELTDCSKSTISILVCRLVYQRERRIATRKTSHSNTYHRLRMVARLSCLTTWYKLELGNERERFATVQTYSSLTMKPTTRATCRMGQCEQSQHEWRGL